MESIINHGKNLILKCALKEKESTSQTIEYINSPECTKDVVNYVNENNTPLSMACTHNNYKLVEALIKKGADVNHVNNITMTPLQIAIFYGGVASAIENGINPNMETIKLLINANADVHFKGKFSPFILACMTDNADVVGLLLSHDVDINFKDYTGSTGRDYLKAEKNEEGIKLVESYIFKNNLEIELSNRNNKSKKLKV